MPTSVPTVVGWRRSGGTALRPQGRANATPLFLDGGETLACLADGVISLWPSEKERLFELWQGQNLRSSLQPLVEGAFSSHIDADAAVDELRTVELSPQLRDEAIRMAREIGPRR